MNDQAQNRERTFGFKIVVFAISATPLAIGVTMPTFRWFREGMEFVVWLGVIGIAIWLSTRWYEMVHDDQRLNDKADAFAMITAFLVFGGVLVLLLPLVSHELARDYWHR